VVARPRTDTVKFTEVRQNLSSVVNEAHSGKRRVLIEKSGIPVAAIVSISDLRQLEGIEAQRDRAVQMLAELREATRNRFEEVPEDEMVREGIRTAREAREELYRERPELYGRSRTDSKS